jgi:hypothetical protein
MMIALWFLGDGGRFLYYIMIGAPVQFLIGGILTVCMDAVVLIQFFLWRHKMVDEDEGNDSMAFEGHDEMQKASTVSNVSV